MTKIIGQDNLKKQLSQLIDSNSFPRFSILVGIRGSGKRLMACWIATRLGDMLCPDIGTSISDIRSLIQNAYKNHGTVTYIIPNADRMSIEAKNALLKVTEESPNKAYFILLLDNINNTLDTIRSRATIFHMDIYTAKEIEMFANSCLPKDVTDKEQLIRRIVDLCETPGEVKLLLSQGVEEFYGYVRLVLDNIAEVSGANSFKIPGRVALKADAEGYDLQLFWKIFKKLCLERFMETGDVRYGNWLAITNRYMKDVGISGINRQMLMDMWILDVRKEWSYGR